MVTRVLASRYYASIVAIANSQSWTSKSWPITASSKTDETEIARNVIDYKNGWEETDKRFRTDISKSTTRRCSSDRSLNSVQKYLLEAERGMFGGDASLINSLTSASALHPMTTAAGRSSGSMVRRISVATRVPTSPDNAKSTASTESSLRTNDTTTRPMTTAAALPQNRVSAPEGDCRLVPRTVRR